MRPDEQARRDAQAAAARGEGAPPEPIQVQIAAQHTYLAFQPLPPQVLPDGTRLLQFLTPDGVLHSWALGPDAARDLGHGLAAPSVEIAGSMPSQNGAQS